MWLNLEMGTLQHDNVGHNVIGQHIWNQHHVLHLECFFDHINLSIHIFCHCYCEILKLIYCFWLEHFMKKSCCCNCGFYQNSWNIFQHSFDLGSLLFCQFHHTEIFYFFEIGMCSASNWVSHLCLRACLGYCHT